MLLLDTVWGIQKHNTQIVFLEQTKRCRTSRGGIKAGGLGCCLLTSLALGWQPAKAGQRGRLRDVDAAWLGTSASAAWGCSQPGNDPQDWENPPLPVKQGKPGLQLGPATDVWLQQGACQPPGTASPASPQDELVLGDQMNSAYPRELHKLNESGPKIGAELPKDSSCNLQRNRAVMAGT